MFEEARALGRPADDELEVTLIGPGFGESIVVHLGGGEWMVVDSCSRGGVVFPLAYLDALAVDRRRVKRVIATHWDLDHVDGLGRVVEGCPEANFVLPAALEPELVVQYIGAAEDHIASPADELINAGQRFRRSTQEFKRALASAPAHRYVLEDRPIRHRDADGLVPRAYVTALSPCDLVLTDHLAQLAEIARSLGRVNDAVLEDYLDNRLTRNACSVAVWVQVGSQHVLLGADLEMSREPGRGWNAVIDREGRDANTASAVKVPHHGSAEDIDPAMWAVLVKDEPLGFVAPWFRGGRWLPSDEGLRELTARTAFLWCTRLNPASAYVPPDYHKHADEVGYVSLRANAGGGPWSVVNATCAVSVA